MDFKRFMQGPGYRPPAVETREPGEGEAHQTSPRHGMQVDCMGNQNEPEEGDACSPRTRQRHGIIPSGTQFVTSSEDTLHSDVLDKMRSVFQLADADGSGRLAPAEFVEAFADILQTEEGSDEEALLKLFCRIDANSDGTIDWDEFSQFMLLENQGSLFVQELETAVKLMPPAVASAGNVNNHTGAITAIIMARLPNSAQRYVTCSKDGTVKVWNPKDLSHVRTISIGSTWVTSAVITPLSQKLAVTTFSREMKVYDLGTFEPCGKISDIEYAPMSMDVWIPRGRREEVELVSFGDGGGWLRVYELKLNPLADKRSTDRFLGTPVWAFQHHKDWITSVKYLSDISTIVASSLDCTLSMNDAEQRVPLKLLEGHTKGVTCFGYSPVYKLIASGGQDRRIILWNMFSQKPLAQLQGHASSVTAVVVNDSGNQILSLGHDKTVKVWDIRNHKCIDTVSDNECYKAEDTLNAMLFDVERHQVVTGNQALKVWSQVLSVNGTAGHRAPITRALYNSLFCEVVSGDHSGMVSVWSAATGKLRFRFYNAHGDSRLTAMAFDVSQRRVLTGSEAGGVKVWNFSSGACISELATSSQKEVTSIAAVHGSMLKHFMVAGWDRAVTLYEDSAARKIGPGRVLKGHRSDVLDMVLMEKYPTLVTACDDGDIWAWNCDSGQVRCVLPLPRRDLPVNETACEAVRFFHGRWRGVLAAAYADGYVRLWQPSTSALLLEVFTAHKVGETVLCISIDPDNERVATADSAGYVKVWDATTVGLTQASTIVTAPISCAGSLTERAVWKAHDGQVSSLNWAAMPAGRFLLSAAHDKSIKLWDEGGVLVGTFGHASWSLDDPATWEAKEQQPLKEAEVYDMQVAASSIRPVPLSQPSEPSNEYEIAPSQSASLGCTSAASQPTAQDPAHDRHALLDLELKAHPRPSAVAAMRTGVSGFKPGYSVLKGKRSSQHALGSTPASGIMQSAALLPQQASLQAQCACSGSQSLESGQIIEQDEGEESSVASHSHAAAEVDVPMPVDAHENENPADVAFESDDEYVPTALWIGDAAPARRNKKAT